MLGREVISPTVLLASAPRGGEEDVWQLCFVPIYYVEGLDQREVPWQEEVYRNAKPAAHRLFM